MPAMMPLDVALWSKVAKSEEGCWLWTAALNGKGKHAYGVFRHNKKKRYAHRTAWELTYGPIPAGIEVCHRCDNPTCCRPDHLFLAPHIVNMQDMGKKGRAAGFTRQVRGSEVGNSKLTEADVLEIRLRAAAGEGGGNLARAFGISPGQASHIINRKSWKHLECAESSAA